MIIIPSNLTEDVLLNGLRDAGSWLGMLLTDRGKCHVSLDRLEWVEPGAITPLASLAFGSQWEVSAPTSSVHSYLQRMRFTEILGLEAPYRFSEHDPAGRFIPAVWITGNENIEPIIQELKAILHQSQLEWGVQWAAVWSINEFLGNVLIHSCARDGGLVFAQVFPSRSIMQIAVCDLGIGISGSVRQSSPAWNGADDLALELALQQGWTSKKGGEGKGNGLYLVQKIIQHNGPNSRLVLISGNAVALASANKTTYEEIPLSWPGTSISCTFDLSRRVDMEEILGHTDDLGDDEIWEVEE